MNYFSAVSFLLCLALTPLIRYIALKNDWVAYPSQDRWHKKPTALMGGIGIYGAVALPLFMLADFATILPHIFRPMSSIPLPSLAATLWIGMTGLFLLGLIDDFIHIKPYTKLIGQILAASVIAFFGFRLHWFQSLTLDTMVTMIWIVGITNAFNLLDNMDGLCAGIGTIASLYFAALYATPSPTVSAAALILAGALAAFLIYNFKPASIFMGDSGSLVIGFFLAMLSLYYAETPAANTLSIYVVPVMVLMVPIFDTTLVSLIRFLSGRSISTGGRDHTSHRLVLIGLSEKGAVIFLYGIGIVAGMSALFVSRTDTLTSPAAIIPLLLSVLLIGIYLARLRIYPEKEFSRLLERRFTPILLELTYKRQLLLVVLDFCLISFSYYLSYRLRFDSDDFSFFFKSFLQSLPAVIICKLIAFHFTGIYRGFWRYLSTTDVFLFIKGSFFATLLSIAAVTYLYRFENFSKGIFMIDWLLITGLLLGTRGSFRIFDDALKKKTRHGDRVIIYGAGRGGEILLREILNNDRHHIQPVAFIDDDPMKIGKSIHGYPVLTSFSEIESVLAKEPANGLIVSFNHARSEQIESIKSICRQQGLFLKRFTLSLESIDL